MENYRKEILALKTPGIEPLLTIHHFTNPMWFEEKGAFTRRENLQDYLDLGAEGRMNFPGTRTSDNWTWRAKDGYLTDELAQRICKMTKLYGRMAKEEKKTGTPVSE